MGLSTQCQSAALIAVSALACRQRSAPLDNDTAPSMVLSTTTSLPDASANREDRLYAESRIDMNPIVDRGAQEIDSQLQTLENVRPEGYVPLSDFDVLPDGKGVERDSREWAGRFFSAAANPYAPGNRARRMYHTHTEDTYDVLRHDYTAADMDLRVLETVELTFISVERGSEGIPALPQQEQIRQISRIAGRVLAMEVPFLVATTRITLIAGSSWCPRRCARERDSAQSSTRPWSGCGRLRSASTAGFGTGGCISSCTRGIRRRAGE